MNHRQLQTVEQVRQFLKGSEVVKFRGLTAREKYYWIQKVLIRFKYYLLKRNERGVIRRYIVKVTGCSRSQVSRLITKYKRTGDCRKWNTKDAVSPTGMLYQKSTSWAEQMNCMGG